MLIYFHPFFSFPILSLLYFVIKCMQVLSNDLMNMFPLSILWKELIQDGSRYNSGRVDTKFIPYMLGKTMLKACGHGNLCRKIKISLFLIPNVLFVSFFFFPFLCFLKISSRKKIINVINLFKEPTFGLWSSLCPFIVHPVNFCFSNYCFLSFNFLRFTLVLNFYYFKISI